MWGYGNVIGHPTHVVYAKIVRRCQPLPFDSIKYTSECIYYFLLSYHLPTYDMTAIVCFVPLVELVERRNGKGKKFLSQAQMKAEIM